MENKDYIRAKRYILKRINIFLTMRPQCKIVYRYDSLCGMHAIDIQQDTLRDDQEAMMLWLRDSRKGLFKKARNETLIINGPWESLRVECVQENCRMEFIG